MTTAIVPRVFINSSNAIVADSRDVAAYFDKDHKNVLRDIDVLISKLPDGGVENFEHTPYIHPQNGQSYRGYEMTRDGFTLLAMGFTGAKAGYFKESFIEQYNAMAAELKAKAPAIP